MRLTGFLLPAALVLSVATRASTQTVAYNNGGPNGVSGGEMSNYVRADDFVFGSTSTFNQIRFWDDEISSEPPGYSGHGFTWWIFSTTPDPHHVSGQMPGSILYTGTATPTRDDQGPIVGGAERYQNDLFIESLTLGPGTYWLGLNEGTNFNYDFIYWETTNPDGTYYSYFSQGGTNNWQFNNDGTYAFELLDNTSSVPEPASMTLLATGLIGVFGVTRLASQRAGRTMGPPAHRSHHNRR